MHLPALARQSAKKNTSMVKILRGVLEICDCPDSDSDWFRICMPDRKVDSFVCTLTFLWLATSDPKKVQISPFETSWHWRNFPRRFASLELRNLSARQLYFHMLMEKPMVAWFWTQRSWQQVRGWWMLEHGFRPTNCTPKDFMDNPIGNKC